MPRFTDTQTITYLNSIESIVVATNHGTSGELVIAIFDGEFFVDADTIAESGAKEIFVRGQTVRYTPTNGMAYNVQLGV